MTSEILLPFALTFITVLGALLGSFLNVVAYRVPAGLSVVSPPSACPHCENQIRARHNLPVIGWLVLRGRCYDCKAPISVRYPIVEAATAALFAVLTVRVGLDPLLPFLLWAAAAAVALFLIDLDTFRLPDKVSAHVWGAALAGTVVAALPAVAGPGRTMTVLLTCGGSALAWLAAFAVPYYATGRRGMGFGDVKLAPALGLILGWFGWSASAVGWFAGILIGALVGVGLMVFSGATGKTKVPYGPFMLAGALIGLLTGPTVTGWYLTLFGL